MANIRVNDPFVIVRLIAARPRPNDPQLSITISVKVTSLQENVEVLMQGAQTAITAAGIESQGDLASGLESGVSHLEGTLKSIVDVIVGKMDVMAEVCRALESCDYILTVASRQCGLASSLCQYCLEGVLCFV